MDFNDEWLFSLDGGEFKLVRLPHDWLIYDVNDLYKSGVGRYRKGFDLDLQGGQRVFLNFDGVYQDCRVIVNGGEAGGNRHGYTPFEVEITGFTKRGGNTAEVIVNYESPNSRWYSGAGIYRGVELKTKEAAHFVTDGIYFSAKKENGRYSYEATAELEDGGKRCEVTFRLLDKTGKIVSDMGVISEWSPENPYLYTLEAALRAEGALVGTQAIKVGFRDVKFTPEGFFLNGEKRKLFGVCLHHDLGMFGAEFNEAETRYRLSLMKEMGANAVRCAHNPPAKRFLDICDELGLLVMSEITDMWKLPKNKFDYARFFDEWIEDDIRRWVRRDRNHASVIMWSVGNEVYDTHADYTDGAATLQRLMDAVKAHDPRGNAAVTLCSNYMPWENTRKCADIIKLIGYNYAERLYEKDRKEHPDWIIYGSETCAIAQSRGVYKFPLEQFILTDDDLQCSSLGNCATSWGARDIETCLSADLKADFSLGQFLWTGQDYLGEPTPYHTRSSYLGMADTAGFPKDGYYICKAAWTDYREKPFVHIFPYWDWNGGEIIDVRVATNAPAVRLFCGGEDLGVKRLVKGETFIAAWKISFDRAKIIEAFALDDDGHGVAAAACRAFGEVVGLNAEWVRFGDLCRVSIFGVDKDGFVVENSNRRVNVKAVRGELVGLDNGDSADSDGYRVTSKRLFNGRLAAIVCGCPDDGHCPVAAELDEDDIPVRRIDLTAKENVVSARILPENAGSKDGLVWRVTDAAGIDSPLAALDVAEDLLSAALKPKGDGIVYIRCGAKNGRPHVTNISVLRIELSGYGTPFLNPFEFVTGGLADLSNVPLGNGNERGIATARDGETHAGFSRLDFGKDGGDTLNIAIFAMSQEPFVFELWDGMPDDGGIKLTDVHYNLGSEWNVYKPIDVKLPRRLTGVHTLAFVTRKKIHIGGFTFKRHSRAFDGVNASEADSVYGDNYSFDGGSIIGIGANVTVTFNDMDFGAGASQIAVTGRANTKNSILLELSDEAGITRQMLEFEAANGCKIREFMLSDEMKEKARHHKKMSLIFLPGSNIDLAFIKFNE